MAHHPDPVSIQDGLTEEAGSMGEATVYWLCHTGISDDVKRRPREHVRDDAGHSSSAITDKYIDIELRERHRTAKNKPILDTGRDDEPSYETFGPLMRFQPKLDSVT